MVVAELRERVDDFLSERCSAELRYLRGSAPTVAHEPFPELADPDSFSQLATAANAPDRTELGKRRLRRLQRLVVGQLEEALAGDAVGALSAQLAGAHLVAAGERINPRDAEARLFGEESREKRSAYATAIAQLYLDEPGFARRAEASVLTAARVGGSSYPALIESLEAFELAELHDHGAAFLARSEDAYRDVLGFALRRVDPQIRTGARGDGRLHDLWRLSVAPWLLGEFRREELLPAVTRWLSEWGFHPSADRRIRFALDGEAGAAAGYRALAVRVPEEVHLLGRPVGGMRDYRGLAAAYGPALLWSSLSADAPVEDRWLPDRTFVAAIAALFRGVIADERWLSRYLRSAHSVAREGARVAALIEQADLRYAAAMFEHERELYTRGSSAGLLEEFADRVRATVQVGADPGLGLSSVLDPFASVHALRGAALGERLRRSAEERFNEDWWRNPAASSWLRKVFADGVREDAETMAAAEGGPLDGAFVDCAARQVSVLAA